MDMYLDTNVINFAYVRATRTVAQAKARHRERLLKQFKVLADRRAAAERKKHSDSILQQLGPGPKKGKQ